MSRKRIVVVLLLLSLAALAATLGSRLLPSNEGLTAYNLAPIGASEDQVMKSVVLPHAPGGFFNFVIGYREVVMEEGVLSFHNDEITHANDEDGSVVYRSKESNQVLGRARRWDSDKYGLTVMFGPDGKVIGRQLSQDKPPPGFLDEVRAYLRALFD